MKRGQSSSEFVVLTAFMLVFFILMTIAIQNQLLAARLEKNFMAAEEIANLINQEVSLAEDVHSGYVRVFSLPAELNSQPYSLAVSPDGYDLTVLYQNQEIVFFMDGDASRIVPLEPGTNTIRN